MIELDTLTDPDNTPTNLRNAITNNYARICVSLHYEIESKGKPHIDTNSLPSSAVLAKFWIVFCYPCSKCVTGQVSILAGSLCTVKRCNAYMRCCISARPSC